ncbi:putative baseplate assembly protein [Actinoplanes sp. CA-030573]|uniref:putative baseplate assembly protein n=1 Tax=Actinoplanes sp. CA-030573 TaxID=3239898 RepID=UPI003D8B34E4
MSCPCGCRAPAHPITIVNRPGLEVIAYRIGTHGEFLHAMLARLGRDPLAGLTVRGGDDLSVALLDCWASVADVLTFYQQRIAPEGYLRTATEQQSLQWLGRLVGYRPRPGISSSTYLSYTLEPGADPAADTAVTIPRGARANSVPGPGELPQAFETAADLPARLSFNALTVATTRPILITPQNAPHLTGIWVTGLNPPVRPADWLIVVVTTPPVVSTHGNEGAGEQLTPLQVRSVRPEPPVDATEIRIVQPETPAATPALDALRRVVDTARADPIVRRKAAGRDDRRLLAPIQDYLTDPAGADHDAARAAVEHLREAHAQAVQRGYRDIARWLEPVAAALALPSRADRSDLAQAVDEVTGPLAAPPARPPAGPRALDRPTRTLFGASSGLVTRLLETLRPELGGVAAALAGTPAPETPLRQIHALTTTAPVFGATAPPRQFVDEKGRVGSASDWPLAGSTWFDIQATYDDGVPIRWVITVATGGRTWTQAGTNDENFPIEMIIGPASVWVNALNGNGYSFSFTLGAIARMVTLNTTVDETVQVDLLVGDDSGSVVVHEDTVNTTVDGDALVAQRMPRVDMLLETVRAIDVLPGVNPFELILDHVVPGIVPGDPVLVRRPRRQQPLIAARIVESAPTAVNEYGMARDATRLVLDHRWLDPQDLFLGDVRDTSVHLATDTLTLAEEPVPPAAGESEATLGGDVIELTTLVDGLEPGRWLVVSGERMDLPGVTSSELVMLADATVTGPTGGNPLARLHTTLHLAGPLGHRYRLATARVLANIVPATNGETVAQVLGSGDAEQPGQTFTLSRSPLTWLPDPDPRGAASTLAVRVDGVAASEADDFVDAGPADRVFVSGTGADGRTSVTFGDGVRGARLPTGVENVSATYRVGTGSPGNLGPDRITQLATRPLGVSAVTNPIPATGGADADDATAMRRNVPLGVLALDRLVSITDYADFTRARAGIAKASAVRLTDGDRQVVHVTVAAIGDAPIDSGSTLLTTLRAALTENGDTGLPVRVEPRHLTLLVISAGVRVLPAYDWNLVEPAVRAALLARFAFARRELGQPAYAGEVLACAQAVPGVDYVDLDVFQGIAELDGAALTGLAARLTPPPRPVVPAATARFDRATGEIRPAELAVLSPAVPDTLILREIRS